MTPSDEIIRTTHLPQFESVYFDLKNQYKIVLSIYMIIILLLNTCYMKMHTIELF